MVHLYFHVLYGGSYFIHHLYLFMYIAWCSCLTATRGVPSIPFFCCWCFSIFSFSQVFCNTVQFILSISFELQLPITESLNTTGGHFCRGYHPQYKKFQTRHHGSSRKGMRAYKQPIFKLPIKRQISHANLPCSITIFWIYRRLNKAMQK